MESGSGILSATRFNIGLMDDSFTNGASFALPKVTRPVPLSSSTLVLD